MARSTTWKRWVMSTSDKPILKLCILSALLLTVDLSAKSRADEESEIAFAATLAKASYCLGEDVWLRIVFQNEGKDSALVPELRSTLDGLQIVVEDSQSRRMRSIGLQGGSWRPELDIGLPPGDSQGIFVNLVSTHGSRVVAFAGEIFIPLGKYRVYCYTGNPSLGTMISDTLSFAVVQPEGEEAIAWRAFFETEQSVMDLVWSLGARGNEQRLAQYRTYVREYPRSHVAPRLLSHMIGYDRRRMRDYITPLMENYPDSPYADEALTILLGEEDIDKEQLLSELAKTKSDTHVGRVAKEVLAGHRPISTIPELLAKIAETLEE